MESGGVLLSELTTLRTGGRARRSTTAETLGELVEAIAAADVADRRLLLIGGGSNLVAPDDGWAGEVVLIRSRGVQISRRDGEVGLRIEAGEPWDDVVARSVEAGWSGLECLSGIPGLAGATPVQNVNAYGCDVADSIAAVEVLDRQTGELAAWSAAECRFGYRDSRFKHTDRFVVLAVHLALGMSPQSRPIRYAELASRLGVAIGDRAPALAVREAVLDLRRSKGMVLDDADHDTWSVGSFFTNPVLTPADYQQFTERARAHVGPTDLWPVFSDPNGQKLSAAWLIEQAGFAKGYAAGAAALSTKHALALTNRGAATTADILALAAQITGQVEATFGILLNPEPRILAN